MNGGGISTFGTVWTRLALPARRAAAAGGPAGAALVPVVGGGDRLPEHDVHVHETGANPWLGLFQFILAEGAGDYRG